MIRKAAVAGMFYPADPAVLSHDVDQMLTEATQQTISATAVDPTLDKVAPPEAYHGAPARFPDRVLRAVIVPHAGYIYSGLTAATAYALVGEVQKEGQEFDCAVIVGPTHRVAVAGCAYPTASAFATPLGPVPLLRGIGDAVRGLTGVAPHDETHRDEHAIEVQLPFLQKVLPDTPIVPINAGQIRQEVLADVIERFLTENTLLVISSDLSHYLPYDVANELDALTLGQILSLEGPLQHEQACGATPINGVIELARRHGWYPVLLAACNSGDTAGDKDRVVGYTAIAFFEAALDVSDDELAFDEAVDPDEVAAIPAVGKVPAVELDETKGTSGLPNSVGANLIAHARAAIEHRLGIPTGELPEWGDWASQQSGTFVTLTKDGELRGCIGSLVDDRPLTQSVPANALNAAFNDPRFGPVTAGEWPAIEVEVSVLTQPEPILVPDGAGGQRPPATEAEALAALQPGVDGVIFSARGRQSTFLPQVWDQLPDPQKFLAHLRAKAGLPADYWGPDAQLFRYHVQAWEQNEVS